MSDPKKPYLPFAFGRMPGWAISLSVALVATCIAVLAIANVDRQARARRAEEYKQCLANSKSTAQVIDVFGQLRDADQSILDAISASPKYQPTTAAGHVLVDASQKRVDAYNELLTLAAKAQKVDCSLLK